MARITPNEMDTTPLSQTTLTDPASNTITVDILDNYSSVLITTTTYWVAQTLPSPTKTSEVKRFTIYNNDTSTHAISVNNKNIYPGMAKYFIWDGTAWCWNDWDVEWLDFMTPEIGTRYYIPYSVTCTTTTTASPSADRVYYIPYITRQEMVVANITMVWTVWVAGSSVAMWIYESDANWLPTNLLWSSGQISTAVVGWWTASYNFSPNLVIPANKTIWLSCAFTSAALTIRYLGTAAIAPILWTTLGTLWNTHLRTTLTAWVWTDLPSPAPSIWSFSILTSAVPALTLWLINQG